MKQFLKKNLRQIISIALLFIGISLIGINYYTKYQAKSLAQNAAKIARDKVELTKLVEKTKDAEASFDYDQVTAVNINDLLAMREKLESLDGIPVEGRIDIPDLDISMPIVRGVSNEALFIGAGTMTADQKMGQGNYSLASHTVFDDFAKPTDQLFSNLHNAKVDQLIYITDSKNIYTYRIADVFIVEPTQVEVIDEQEGKKLLTLITCTDYQATQRIIVQAELIHDTESGSNDIPEVESYEDFLESHND